jgi:hypothetical protein
VYVGKGGDSVGTKQVLDPSDALARAAKTASAPSDPAPKNAAREALKFFFSDDGLWVSFYCDES